MGKGLNIYGQTCTRIKPARRLACATAGQGPELFSPGRQSAINKLYSQPKVFKIVSGSTLLAPSDILWGARVSPFPLRGGAASV